MIIGLDFFECQHKANKKMSHCVYGLQDPRTNETRYIGQTKNPKKRYKDHTNIKRLESEKTHKSYWILSLLKQGIKPKMKIIHISKEKKISQIEKEYILENENKLTNTTLVINDCYSLSEQTKKRLSESQKNRLRQNPQIKEQWRISIEKHYSNNKNRDKQRKILKNYHKNNPEAAKEASERTKKHFSKKENRLKASKNCGGKKFDVFSKETGKYIGSWTNQAICAEELNVDRSNLNACLKNRIKSHKGFLFIFSENKHGS